MIHREVSFAAATAASRAKWRAALDATRYDGVSFLYTWPELIRSVALCLCTSLRSCVKNHSPDLLPTINFDRGRDHAIPLAEVANESEFDRLERVRIGFIDQDAVYLSFRGIRFGVSGLLVAGAQDGLDDFFGTFFDRAGNLFVEGAEVVRDVPDPNQGVQLDFQGFEFLFEGYVYLHGCFLSFVVWSLDIVKPTDVKNQSAL